MSKSLHSSLRLASATPRLQLEAIMDNAAVGILFTDGRILAQANAQCADMFGYSLDEFIGQSAEMLYPDLAAYDALRAQATPLLQSGRQFKVDYQMRRRNGELFWCHMSARAVNPGNLVVGTLWVIEDVTEERMLRAELEHRTDELTAVFNTPAIGMLVVRERVIVAANTKLESILGYPPGELTGQSTRVLYHSDEDYENIGQALYPQLVSGVSARVEWPLRRADGSIVWTRVFGNAFDPDKVQAGSVWLMEDVTEERSTRQVLEYKTNELKAVFDTPAIGILVARERKIVDCNQRLEQIFGFDGGSLIGQSTRVLYPSDEEYEETGRLMYEELAKGGMGTHSREIWTQRRSGEPLCFRLFGNVFDPADVQAGSVWLLEDITEKRQTQEQARQVLEEQQAIFETAAVGILFARDRIVHRVNPKLAAMLGYQAGELAGSSVRVFYADENDYERNDATVLPLILAGEPASIEVRARHRSGHELWVRVTGKQVAGSVHQDVIWIFEDVTERHEAEDALHTANERLEQRVTERTADLEGVVIQLQQEVFERMQAERRVWEMAHHDGLTGLPNRALLHDRLGQALEQAQRDKKRATVMFIDLDRFKNVNDTLGHAVGDELLQAVAQRLKSVVRAVDTVSRFGGDEFVIVLYEIASPDDAVLVAEKILAVLSPPVCLAGSVIRITPSIGIAVYPDDGMDAVMLMKNADTAMYHAKAVGRNNFQFFSRQMNEQASRFFEMEHRLQQAIDSGQLLLHYQPLIDWSRRAVCGMEALVRWNDPEHGLISPAEFIPVAEESGLIIPLGEWVLSAALEQNRQWQQEGRALVPISVNLSPRQFRQKDLVESVRRILADTGQPASLLELEITESSLMHDVAETSARLHELAAMGVRVAIDDFGTGYSSLAYLKRFPVHKLKVDQSFVRDLTIDPDDVAIVTTVIGLASSMGLDLLAEGVEHQEQLDVLLGLGCRKFQGYFFSRPLPATAVDAIFSPPRLQDSRP